MKINTSSIFLTSTVQTLGHFNSGFNCLFKKCQNIKMSGTVKHHLNNPGHFKTGPFHFTTSMVLRMAAHLETIWQ